MDFAIHEMEESKIDDYVTIRGKLWSHIPAESHRIEVIEYLARGDIHLLIAEN